MAAPALILLAVSAGALCALVVALYFLLRDAGDWFNDGVHGRHPEDRFW